jgi:plastocyanin domain-containing protein
MNQKTIQYLAVGVIVISVLVSAYIILSPNHQGIAQNQDVSGLAPMVNGKQVVTMTVKAASYSPNYFKVKVGVPVKWEITSSGESGCDSGAVVANGLIDTIYLNPNAGQVTTKEFTPNQTGKYTFACTMGMVRGIMEIVN